MENLTVIGIIILIIIALEMTIEEMWQKGCEARREAKALQRKLQVITDTEERKQLARR